MAQKRKLHAALQVNMRTVRKLANESAHFRTQIEDSSGSYLFNVCGLFHDQIKSFLIDIASKVDAYCAKYPKGPYNLHIKATLQRMRDTNRDFLTIATDLSLKFDGIAISDYEHLTDKSYLLSRDFLLLISTFSQKVD